MTDQERIAQLTRERDEAVATKEAAISQIDEEQEHYVNLQKRCDSLRAELEAAKAQHNQNELDNLAEWERVEELFGDCHLDGAIGAGVYKRVKDGLEQFSTLQAHNDVLVAALKPFVEAWDEAEEGDEILTNLDPGLDVNIAVRIKHWLAAKAALSHPEIQARQEALMALVEAAYEWNALKGDGESKESIQHFIQVSQRLALAIAGL